MNLYAWSREGYIVGESGYDEEAIITLYTLSETPSVGDLLYKSDGTPAEQGELKYNDGTNEEVNLNNTVYRVGDGYIDVYGISETGYTELAPDFSRDSQNDLEVETEKPLSKLTIKGKTYYIKDAQARQSLTSKQDTLVSGTNIKTINNQSILGSGNIEIQGGGSSSSTLNFFDNVSGTTLDTQLTLGNAVLVFKNGNGPLRPTHDYTISGSVITFVTPLDASQDTIGVLNGNLAAIDFTPYMIKPTVVTDADNTDLEIEANKIYKFANPITTLTLTSAVVSDYESRIYFTTGNSINFTDNSSIRWGGGITPTLEANTVYCIAICNGLAEIDNYGLIVGE